MWLSKTSAISPNMFRRGQIVELLVSFVGLPPKKLAKNPRRVFTVILKKVKLLDTGCAMVFLKYFYYIYNGTHTSIFFFV
jgi:hypothetical protein